jgi:predicted XRE-type DNA-binding protein
MQEIWRDIEGYEGLYQVSNLGRVKSLDRYRYDNGQFTKGGVLRYSLNHGGYAGVNLCKNGKRIRHTIHKLVATTFIRPSKKGEQINHKNGNKLKNEADNLEWVTSKENHKHRVNVLGKGRGESNGESVLTAEEVKEIKYLLDEGSLYQRQIADIYGVHRSTITCINRGKNWGYLSA